MPSLVDAKWIEIAYAAAYLVSRGWERDDDGGWRKLGIRRADGSARWTLGDAFAYEKARSTR